MTYGLFLSIVFYILIIGSGGGYSWLQWTKSRSFRKGNCLLWKHPDNIDDQMALLEYCKIKNPPGGYWFDKGYWWLPEKKLRWCYELKVVEKGESTFKIMAFVPEEWIDIDFPTARSLGDATDTTLERKALRPRSQLLQNLAWGGTAVMGGVCIIGIMMLVDMLGKGGTA